MECTLDIEDIRALLPHRYPMLLVDRVIDVEAGERVVGYKNVSINEPFFNGHFPGQAVMPGVLILESMAQVASIMILCMPGYNDRLALLGGVEDARFRRVVVPGDRLVTEASKDWFKGDYGRVKLVSSVDGQEVARCYMKFAFKSPVASSRDQVYEKIERARQAQIQAAAASAGGETNGVSIADTEHGVTIQPAGGDANRD